MVVDTSAMLALLFGEPEAPWVAAQMNARRGGLRMSTVNLTETLIHLRDRSQDARAAEDALSRCGIEYIPPDPTQAGLAAVARMRWPLNLGDCFAYALARHLGEPLLALDRDFRHVDVEVIGPPHRSRG
jgi:ribonuclease VapC